MIRFNYPHILPRSLLRSTPWHVTSSAIQNGRETTLEERLLWRLWSLIITTDGFRSYCSSSGYGLLLCASRAKAKSWITRETLCCCSIQILERWSVSEDLSNCFDQIFFLIKDSFCSLAILNSEDSVLVHLLYF